MKVTELELPGVLLIEPRLFHDARGLFLESWHRERYAAAGIAETFVQDNLSTSRRGVVRGLHFQRDPHAQGKLVHAVAGAIFDVAVDVRVGSPTFGRWLGRTLRAEEGHQLYIPPGFAHGFAALTDSATVAYKCTAPYTPEAERTVLWNDPEIGIEWPVGEAVLSEKDRGGLGLMELVNS